ncbi:hypothetical protein CQR46_0548 [Bifidobacterium pseudolongum subsp. globosum]|uniref:Uncharacterized protein n=1 Tax=Bifidobacterium pseudolongum subsp. globosum TaxID=1690 RepID=A0A2N3QIZ4_9BIFI|nr:hypothetical protein [Bifidobacterium pseudolongum]PKU91461.1 hypothetical protein CQR46_0548 [Bifidobacterium pseudolongum subsp. globosum]
MSSPNWTDIIQASCSIISAVAVIITLIFTWRQVKLAAQQICQASQQAERESEDRNRPYVNAQVVPSLGGMGAWDLRIRNTGGTAAREITIRLVEGQFVKGSTADDIKICQRIEKSIDSRFTLQPDTSLRLYWSFYSTTTEEVETGAPLRGTIEVTYRWWDENVDKRYKEIIPYDCETLLIPAPSTGTKQAGKDSEATLINIEHALRSISSNIGELNR